MNAEEVIDAWIDPCGSDTGFGILDALKTAGFVVVARPVLVDAIQWRDWDAVRALLPAAEAS